MGIAVTGRVVVASAEGDRHRAWPAVEVLPDGTLVVAYKRSRDHSRTDDSALVVTRSNDGGRTWREHDAVAAEPGWACITNHGMTRLADGTLLLQLLKERHRPDWHREHLLGREARATFIRSSDGGRTWQPGGEPFRADACEPCYFWQYGRIQELAGGHLLAPFIGLPCGTTDARLRSVGVAFSYDQGFTWNDFVLIHEDRQGDLCLTEPDLVRLPDGRYLAMIRSNAQGMLYRCYSDDDGRSWTAPVRTNLPGHSPALLPLHSGGLLCTYRDVTPGSYGVGMATSADGGETWTVLDHLYRGANADCGYPSMVRSPDGEIFCVYYTAASPDAWTGSCAIHGAFLRESPREVQPPAVSASGVPAARECTISFETQDYVSHQHGDARIDAYVTEPAAGVSARTGLLLLLHGWGNDGQRAYAAEATEFADRYDLVVTRVEYRDCGREAHHPSPGTTFDVPYDFSKLQAIDCLRAAAATLRHYPNLDRHRLLLWGGSQGGHLGAQCLTFAPSLWAGAVLCSGLYHPFTYEEKLQRGYASDLETYPEIGFVEYALGSGGRYEPAEVEIRSALRNAGGMPEGVPIAIVHGTRDRSCDVKHAVDLYSRLLALGKQARLYAIAGGGHRLVEAEAPDERSRLAATVKYASNVMCHRRDTPGTWPGSPTLIPVTGGQYSVHVDGDQASLVFVDA